MEPIAYPTPGFYSQDPATRNSLQASQTQLAAISSSRSVDLDLVTEEGDKVTLSIDTLASAIYASHTEVAMDDDDLYAQWSEFSGGQFERDVTFTVEGDLNRQERREIRKVIKAVNQMMHQFVQGNLNPMMAMAQKLQGLETIDSLQVEMAYERQVLVAQQTQAAVAYTNTGEPAAIPHAPVDAVELPLKEEAEAVADDMAEVVGSAQAPMDPLRELADRLLQAYRDRAAAWDPLGGRIMDHIRDVFEAAMNAFGPMANAGTETPSAESD